MRKGKKISDKKFIELGLGGLGTGFAGMLFESPEEDENRKVARYGKDSDDLVIDTCFTPDTGYFETGIKDKRYYESWIIVEEYSTKESAAMGHKRWVKHLTSNRPPKSLYDINIEEEFTFTP